MSVSRSPFLGNISEFSIINQVIIEYLALSLAENGFLFPYNHLRRGDYSGRTNSIVLDQIHRQFRSASHQITVIILDILHHRLCRMLHFICQKICPKFSS